MDLHISPLGAGLLALLLALLMGVLWARLRRGAAPRQGKRAAPITEEMVQNKLAQINLDLQAPPGNASGDTSNKTSGPGGDKPVA